MFCGTESVVSHFHVLRNQSRFPRYRGHRVPFSCFALSNSFSAVPRASGPVFLFCAPELIFGGTEGVRSYFHVLRARTHFLLYQGLRLPFYCSACPNSFSAVPRASCPNLMSCSSGLVFGSTEVVRSRFHVLHSRTCFRRCRVSRVAFSYFARPDSFSAVPRSIAHVFMFCACELVFNGTETVSFRFHVFRSRTRFRRYRGLEDLF
jgi:hypothetical protein